MPASLTRRDLFTHLSRLSALACLVLAASCTGGTHASFASNSGTPVVAPTNVAGKSDTSGISAGAALQPVGSTPTPKG